jgi:iron-sulfur cluster assembly protein
MNITVTGEAVNILRENKQQDNQIFRVGVLPGGCSGFQYNLQLEDTIEDDDIQVEIASDITIAIDAFSAQYLDGVILDYKSSMMGSGFTFNNPVAVSGCGCGSSFTV